jgi:hypothetical protein
MVKSAIEKKRTVILQGYQLQQSHIRPHEALYGKTPKAGSIQIKGHNKWQTLQNASKANNPKI